MSTTTKAGEAKELIQRWATAAALVTLLTDRYEEAREVSRRIGAMVDEQHERMAEAEAEAIRALAAWDGGLIVDGVKWTIGEQYGEPVLKGEPMGDFGVKRIPNPSGGAA